MEVWKRWGKLLWRELFNRSIELVKNGFVINEYFVEKMSVVEYVFRLDKDIWCFYIVYNVYSNMCIYLCILKSSFKFF